METLLHEIPRAFVLAQQHSKTQQEWQTPLPSMLIQNFFDNPQRPL